MNKILSSIITIILTTVVSGCSSLPKYFKATNKNDRVYVAPHKPLELPKIKGDIELPAPNADTSPVNHYVVEPVASTKPLTLPPLKYEQPANTAPIGVLGEDEELKELRRKPNPDATPSKKSIWGNH